MINLFAGLIAQTRPLDPLKGEVGIDEFEGVPTIKGFEAIFENVISVVLSLGAFALFIMLVSGGMRFLTAGDDPKAAEGAKKTITTAIGGIVLLVLSYLILVFIKQFTGMDVTSFKVFSTQ
ncbi:pilin [Patescibacteria group bacterium]|nr:pilin [Patescibacteria group bacterium]MBU2036552.1 pilin [Patescibacteria group bacterium]